MKAKNLTARKEKLPALLRLSHELGNLQRPLAILGEGNTSARLDDRTFLVKASGSVWVCCAGRTWSSAKPAGLLSLLDCTGFPTPKWTAP